MNITYCANGCKRAGDPVITEGRTKLCRRCEDNLHNWLTKIPDLYALLPGYTIPGSIEKNPESKATKRAEVAAPLRLDVLDLLDTRLGRKWLGTAAAEDRRGVLGTLEVHARAVIDERHVANTLGHPPTVTQVCALLDRHRLWIAEQDWITYLYEDVKQVHRNLSDATGDYRRPPVGHCHVEDDNGRCDGPLYANTYGGVHCAKCRATWDAAHLRQLGLAQAEAQTKETA